MTHQHPRDLIKEKYGNISNHFIWMGWYMVVFDLEQAFTCIWAAA